jgi:hypothetical protein
VVADWGNMAASGRHDQSIGEFTGKSVTAGLNYQFH